MLVELVSNVVEQKLAHAQAQKDAGLTPLQVLAAIAEGAGNRTR